MLPRFSKMYTLKIESASTEKRYGNVLYDELFYEPFSILVVQSSPSGISCALQNGGCVEHDKLVSVHYCICRTPAEFSKSIENYFHEDGYLATTVFQQEVVNLLRKFDASA